MNPAEFITSFEKYSGQIYGYVYLRVGKQKEVAQDITQEVFLKAWKHIAKFDPRLASIKTWLFVIARRLVIDFLRGSKPTEQFDTTAHTNEQLENVGLLEYVKQALSDLDQKSQELITLRFVLGLEIQEIAQITRKSYPTTKVAIHRALNKLKQKLNE